MAALGVQSLRALGCRPACARPCLKAAPVLLSRKAGGVAPNGLACSVSVRVNTATVLPRISRKSVTHVVNSAAGAAAPAPVEKAPFKWGANMKNLAICIGLGAAIAIAPAPTGVSPKAWNLLAIFVGTIVGIITTPLPLGAVAILGLGVSMLTKTLTFAEAFSAFATEIP